MTQLTCPTAKPMTAASDSNRQSRFSSERQFCKLRYLGCFLFLTGHFVGLGSKLILLHRALYCVYIVIV